MYNTNTITYTVIDIRKTFEGCEADIRTIARRTRKWSMEDVDNVFHDILALAENGYLNSVDIVLLDSNDKVLKASKFVINSDGSTSSGDRAGRNNDWSNIPNTELSVILSYTQEWKSLSQDEKQKFQSNKDFKLSWVSTRIDNTFPHLTSNAGQLYASNRFELQKTNYK
jgi:Bacterial HORMA domain family 1